MMTKPAIPDRGQKLEPYGRVIGIVDTEQELNSAIKALNDAGVPTSRISYLQGKEGVHLLERAEGFFFSDAEDDALKEHLQELKTGGFVLRVRVADEEEATRVAHIAGQYGAKHFAFFGMWVVTQLS